MPAYRRTERQAIDPLLLVDSFFAVSQICGFASSVKIYHSYPAMDRSIKMVRQLEQVSEPYCMMFRELGGGRKRSHNGSTKKRENKEEKEKK